MIRLLPVETRTIKGRPIVLPRKNVLLDDEHIGYILDSEPAKIHFTKHVSNETAERAKFALSFTLNQETESGPIPPQPFKAEAETEDDFDDFD